MTPITFEKVVFDLAIEVPPYPRVTVHLPKGRGGRAWTNNADALRRLKSFYEEFAWLLRAQKIRALDLQGPLSLHVFMAKRSHLGDADNCLKSVCDAITHAGIWGDDSQVKKATIEDVARGVAPRIRVLIEPYVDSIEALGFLEEVS